MRARRDTQPKRATHAASGTRHRAIRPAADEGLSAKGLLERTP